MEARKYLKITAALIALLYCSLLVYHNSYRTNLQEKRRAVRQSKLKIETSSTVPKKESTVQKKENTVQKKELTVEDVFISVKTTKYYQDTRLPIVLKTWFQLAKEQIWFFTDNDNQYYQKETNGHMINTKCSATHDRIHLCCKMSVEYDHYLESNKKWFCHFDDDNYVNVPVLVKMLQKYDSRQDWYLGKTATDKVEFQRRYSYATGGAGFCISRSLALKMVPVASGGRFISVCEKQHTPDDVTMGYIIEVLMKRKLTIVPEFHSHYERMKRLDPDTFKDQISFSYVKKNDNLNVVNVFGFDLLDDPTRFLSLHCFLFPDFNFCPS